MKATELGVKAALILENALGIYERVFGTHKPLTDIANHLLLKQLIPNLEALRPGLSLRIRELEKLEPTPFGKGNFDPAAGEANTEYPFLVRDTDSTGAFVARLRSPQDYFGQAHAEEYFRLSRELLDALPALYPLITKWKIRLPRPL